MLFNITRTRKNTLLTIFCSIFITYFKQHKFMKKYILLVLLLSATFISTTAFIFYSSGIAGYTSSPSEGTCTTCHGGGTGISTVSITSIPAFTGNHYTPGATYTINVNVQNSGYTKFGFGCEILNSSNTNAGSMTTALTGVKFLTASNGRKNATHTITKSGTGGVTSFSFIWVAPSIGTTTIYSSGIAVNFDGSTNGDQVGSTSLALTPSATDIKEASYTGFTNISIFPNPIVSKFKINYNIATDNDVKVGLFDVQGKLVNELINEKQSSGDHVLNLTLPEGLSKGIYIIKLVCNSNTTAQRLLIVE